MLHRPARRQHPTVGMKVLKWFCHNCHTYRLSVTPVHDSLKTTVSDGILTPRSCTVPLAVPRLFLFLIPFFLDSFYDITQPFFFILNCSLNICWTFKAPTSEMFFINLYHRNYWSIINFFFFSSSFSEAWASLRAFHPVGWCNNESARQNTLSHC